MAGRGDIQLAITDDETEYDLEIQDVSWTINVQKLYEAAMRGKWKDAREIIESNTRTKTARINSEGMTLLQAAATAGNTDFVIEFVRILSPEELAVKDQVRRNALHHVAMACKVEAAIEILKMNPALAKEKEVYGHTPLFYAARWRPPSETNRMLNFLYEETPEDAYIHPETAPSLIVAITASGSHDIALEILKQHPEFVSKQSYSGWSILQVLAFQPSKYLAGKQVSTWEKFIYPWKNSYYANQQKKGKAALELVHTVCRELTNLGPSQVMEYFMPNNCLPILHLATQHGVFELVDVCLSYFPQLIWYTSPDDGKHLLRVAIEHRQWEIFDHLLKLIGNSAKTYAATNFEKDKNNILHVAAKLAPVHRLHSVPGPAFQMREELKWFQAVNALVYKDERFARNSQNFTPIEVFYTDHKELMEHAKGWMKETSNSCMVVAALVATVAFAAMITVPGGNSTTGLPILSNQRLFMIFSISNALSMIFAALALLMFLCLQTSRFSTDDFLKSLPENLIIGLLSLFGAVVTMMVAFGTAVGLSLQTKFKWGYIPITIVACLPAIIFTKLQLPLLSQALKNTGQVPRVE